MKIKKSIFLMLIPLTISLPAMADCRASPQASAPIISFDISNKLTAVSSSIEESRVTLFSGNYICTPSLLDIIKNAVAVYSTLGEKKVTLGFNNGQQFVEIGINKIDFTGFENIPPGTYSASNLNTQFTMSFKLVPSKPTENYINVSGSTFSSNAVIVATDASSALGLGAIVVLLLSLVNKLLRFLLTLQWPVDEKDLYLQPISITYNPLVTTCDFSNKDLHIDLPMITIKDLKTASKPGYTPFSMNFTCSNLIANTNSSRDISIFLASNNLLSSDKTVLKNTLSQGAKNVGFRIVKADNLNVPVILSDSDTAKNNATDIFKVSKAGALPPAFTINMGAYYYPYAINDITAGAVSSSARVVFSYD